MSILSRGSPCPLCKPSTTHPLPSPSLHHNSHISSARKASRDSSVYIPKSNQKLWHGFCNVGDWWSSQEQVGWCIDSGMGVSSTCLGAGSLLLATQTRHPPRLPLFIAEYTQPRLSQTIMRSNDGFRLKFMNYDLGFRVRILFRVFWETVELRLCVLHPLSSLRVSRYLFLRQQMASTCALLPAGEGAHSFPS